MVEYESIKRYTIGCLLPVHILGKGMTYEYSVLKITYQNCIRIGPIHAITGFAQELVKPEVK